jgi:hypothetical protein
MSWEVPMASEILAALEGTDLVEWSDETVELVLASLRSDDAADRKIAASLAWRVAGHRVGRELLRLFREDSDNEVRASAAIGMGPMLEEIDMMLGDDDDDEPIEEGLFEDVQRALREVHEDPREPELVRRRALEAAVRAPEAWMEGAAREALASADPLWRMTGVFAAGHVGGLDSAVVASLHDAEAGVRIEAVRAVANLGLEDAAGQIGEWATSDEVDRDLRLECIVALAELPGDDVAAILEAMSLDDDDEIAAFAQGALDEHRLFQMGANPEDDDEAFE